MNLRNGTVKFHVQPGIVVFHLADVQGRAPDSKFVDGETHEAGLSLLPPNELVSVLRILFEDGLLGWASYEPYVTDVPAGTHDAVVYLGFAELPVEVGTDGQDEVHDPNGDPVALLSMFHAALLPPGPDGVELDWDERGQPTGSGVGDHELLKFQIKEFVELVEQVLANWLNTPNLDDTQDLGAPVLADDAGTLPVPGIPGQRTSD